MEEDHVRRLVKETVSETLLQLGFDMKDPKALQADMAHLRFWRETTTSLTEKSIKQHTQRIPIAVALLLHLVFYGLASKLYWDARNESYVENRYRWGRCLCLGVHHSPSANRCDSQQAGARAGISELGLLDRPCDRALCAPG